jgi:hypothetical protein
MNQKKPDENTFDLQESALDEIDLSQLVRNLSLSPEQRLEEHQNALDLVIKLEKAGRKLREESQ